MLQIHNSLSNSKENFVAHEANKVRMYVCGMTVYDYCHIGHARVMLVFDMVARCLQLFNYDVCYVRNITDIDDKILDRAALNDEPYTDLSDRFIKAMDNDCKRLMLLTPTAQPRATEHIAEIIAMINNLINKGNAYITPNGDVYYSVASFADYGKLSKQKVDQLQIGDRVTHNPDKKDVADFALWKTAKKDAVGFDAPWSRGRPGWHIECSAMALACLGKTLDIHGGGPDLLFPHHENEIAQSEAANDCALANYWMHAGPVVATDGEAMSKSKKNFISLQNALALHHSEVLRYYLLTAHYRSPIDYRSAALEDSASSLRRLYRTLADTTCTDNSAIDETALFDFRQCLEDDFNTPDAFALMFDLARLLNSLKDGQRRLILTATLRRMGAFFGLLQTPAEDFLHFTPTVIEKQNTISDADINALIVAREQARSDSDFAQSDKIRDHLHAQGVHLQDDGIKTSWYRKNTS